MINCVAACQHFRFCPPPITGCRSLPSLLCCCVTSSNSLPFLCGTLLEKELWTWAPCACVSLSEANLSYFGLQLGSGDYWAVTDVSVRNSRCSGNSHHILLGWWQMEWSSSSAASHIWCGLSVTLLLLFSFWMFSGGSYFHVGLLLWVAERGDGDRGCPWPAGRLCGRRGPLPIRTKHGLLSLPISSCGGRQHRLQSLWAFLFGF